MTPEKQNFTVFYSWQSDLPDETNRQAIRFALRSASNKIESEIDSITVVIDEATRNESGSPNIPMAIVEKIKSSDAFVCDITTINSDAAIHSRRTPNPNVLFELGYAAAHLGWGRIVMLFNEAHGKFPADTPFDIDRHRATPYKLQVSDPNKKAEQAKLTNVLAEAIAAIKSKNPIKPFEARTQTAAEIKHSRDISNLKWILSTVHLATFDQMISGLPDVLNSRALHFWESFNGVASNSLFHVYNSEALSATKRLHEAWGKCVSFGTYYHMGTNPDVYIFRGANNDTLDAKEFAAWKNIDAARIAAKESLSDLLGIVRNEFIEIDIEEMTKAAWQEYIDFQRDIEESLAGTSK